MALNSIMLFFSVKGNADPGILQMEFLVLFKTSSMTFWPIYAVVLNLPPSIRYKAAKTMLIALWSGSIKPSMQLFFGPLIDAFNYLYS